MAKSAYEKVYESLKKTIKKTDTSNFEGFFAFQFTVTGDAAGTFYVEFKDGVLSVENFNYEDHTAVFKATAETFTKLVEGELAPDEAVKSGALIVEDNNPGCADIFNAIAPKKAPAKASVKKAPAAMKTAEAAKAEEKKPEAPKASVKAAEAPKAAAKKPASSKRK